MSAGAAISTTWAKPSGRMSRTLPSPSTWPCTKCPPIRSSARTGNSRLTVAPSPTSASDERRSVSFITSALNAPSAIAVAVRQTPLTATESPSPISGASEVRTARRTPSAPAWTAVTVPRSATSPVNTSPLAHAGADQDVVGDPVALQRERAHRLGDPLDPLALQRIAGAGAAEHHRGDEQPDLVDLAGVEEGARQVRAALEQDRGQPAGAELGERVAHTGRLVLPRGHDHVRARRLQGVGGGALGGAADHDGQGQVRRAAQQRRVDREPGLGVEHDPAGLAVGALDP